MKTLLIFFDHAEEVLKKAAETVTIVQRNTMIEKRLQFAAAVIDKKKVL